MYQRGMHMKEHITTPKMSEILLEEFMEPMGLSAYRVAQGIHVPTSRIQDILHDRRKITADTSLRLAKFFGVSDRYYGGNGFLIGCICCDHEWDTALTQRLTHKNIKCRRKIHAELGI